VTWVPLKRVAEVRASNVDKLTVEGESPVRLVNYTDVYYGDRLHPGLDLMMATATTDEASRFRLQQGDVILTKDSETTDDIGISAYVDHASEDMVCGYHLSLVRPRAAVGRYLHYALSSTHARRQMSVAATGVTRFGLRAESVGSLSVWVPPEAEQRAIADYLDAETARIDALIAKKQQLIHLLEERFGAAREMLMTRPRGESPTPSCTGFFDEVPDRWQETTLRHLGVEVQTGPFGSQLHAEEYVEGGWPVVNPANIRGGRIRRVDSMTISDDKRDELSRHILRPGDIVFGRRGEMGRAGLVGESEAGWLCGTGSLRLRMSSERLEPGYLAELLQTAALRNYFLLTSVGSTMDNLNSEIVLSMPCLVPDLGQQRFLVDELKRTKAHFEQLVDGLTRQIELLVEHRQALITATVTGEFVVPGAA
jgi:type I restriction enzyme, S subunit